MRREDAASDREQDRRHDDEPGTAAAEVDDANDRRGQRAARSETRIILLRLGSCGGRRLRLPWWRVRLAATSRNIAIGQAGSSFGYPGQVRRALGISPTRVHHECGARAREFSAL